MRVKYTQELSNAINPPVPWQEIAQAKVNETLNKIPWEWRLSAEQIGAAKQQRTLKGPFFDGFLTDKELEITKLGSLDLVEKIAAGGYSAVEVSKAYFRAAAVAHQIVSNLGMVSLFRRCMIKLLH